MKKCKCEITDMANGDESLILDDESEKMTKNEVRASFYRIMEALEEFKEESSWAEKEICEAVLGKVLRSKNPVSIHELEYFFFLALG
jgi:hypothetical protein